MVGGTTTPTSSPALDRLARAGMCTDGAAHVVVACLVGRLAFGFTSGAASGGGALDLLSRTSPGRVVLYAAALGFAALGLWQAIEACVGYRRHGTRRVGWRVLSAVKVPVYAVIVAQALRLSAGGSETGPTAARGPTSAVLQLPAGPYLVAVVGLATIVVAVFLARFGWVEGFRDTMTRLGASGSAGRVYARLGKVGYVSRAAAVAMVGVLLVHVAVSGDPSEAGGLDTALNDIRETPIGPPVLLALALGLASYGVFCFAWARHLER